MSNIESLKAGRGSAIAFAAALAGTAAGAGTVLWLPFYRGSIADLSGSGRMEWPIRLLLIIAGFLLAVPGGGIMPWSHGQMAWIALSTLAPTLALAWWFTCRGRAVAL